MAFAVGPKLTIPFTVGTSQLVGQGDRPELWPLYTTDNATAATPNWNDASSYVRSFDVSRGRENELDEIGAGTASIVLDNRTRVFDPVSNPLIGPRNGWWL